jgi:hypothetical protein
MKKIICHGKEEPMIGSNAFNGCSKDKILVVTESEGGFSAVAWDTKYVVYPDDDRKILEQYA